jgi:uncharacterized Tic20 family protein
MNDEFSQPTGSDNGVNDAANTAVNTGFTNDVDGSESAEGIQADAQARVSRLSSSTAGQGTQPPVETADEDPVVREYEQRYRPTSKATNDNAFSTTFSALKEKAKRTEAPLSYSTLRVTDDERLWAAVAHASIWITLLGGFLTGGLIVPLSIFVPLTIFLMFRNRSDFVAFHALQAFALQLIATVGVLALLIVGSIIWALGLVIAFLLIVVLIGVILVPLWGLVGISFFIGVFVLPLAAGVLGAIAAVQTYNGRDYQYPYIAPWIDRQLAGGYLNVA